MRRLSIASPEQQRAALAAGLYDGVSSTGPIDWDGIIEALDARDERVRQRRASIQAMRRPSGPRIATGDSLANISEALDKLDHGASNGLISGWEGSITPGAAPPDAARTTRGRGGASARDTVNNFRAINAKMGHLTDVYFFVLRMSWLSFVLVSLAVYAMLALTFALLVFATDVTLCLATAEGFADAFFFSVHTISTIGYGALHPTCVATEVIVAVESYIGLVFAAICTGIVYSKFSAPKPRIEFARPLVIDTEADGADSAVTKRDDGTVGRLQLRLANHRRDEVFNATLSLTVVFRAIDSCGDVYMRREELPLVRADTPSFKFVWLLTHDFGPDDLLFGISQRRARKLHMRFIATFSGVDSVMAETVMVQHVFSAADMQFDSRFRSMVSHANGGAVTVLDYAMLHTTVPSDQCVDHEARGAGDSHRLTDKDAYGESKSSPVRGRTDGGGTDRMGIGVGSDAVESTESSAHDMTLGGERSRNTGVSTRMASVAEGASRDVRRPRRTSGATTPRHPVTLVTSLQQLRSEFERGVARGAKCVLLECYSNSCKQCLRFAPLWQAAVIALEHDVCFLCAEKAAGSMFDALGVSSYPTVLQFDPASAYAIDTGGGSGGVPAEWRRVTGRVAATRVLDELLADRGLDDCATLRKQGPANAAVGASSASRAASATTESADHSASELRPEHVWFSFSGTEDLTSGADGGPDQCDPSAPAAAAAPVNPSPGDPCAAAALGMNVIEGMAALEASGQDIELRLAKDFVRAQADGNPPADVAVLFAAKRVVLFGVPGPFTGTCSLEHVPEYVDTAPALAAEGVDALYCVSVSDCFVMEAWRESLGLPLVAPPEERASRGTALGVTLLSDGVAQLCGVLGMMKAFSDGMGNRCKRFAMVVDDGVVTACFVEDDPADLLVSDAPSVLAHLRERRAGACGGAASACALPASSSALATPTKGKVTAKGKPTDKGKPKGKGKATKPRTDEV